MRISPMARVCSGLLCGFSVLILMTGCSSPSSQNLASLTVTATPSTLSVGGASVLKAVAHLSDGTTQDVTAGTQWTLSNTAMGTVSNGALTAKAAGTVTVQAAYVEAAPAGTSPASATVTPQSLECICASYNYRGGHEQRSCHYLECARNHHLRYGTEQHAVERHGKRCWNLRLHAGGRDGTQSGKTDSFGHLHAERYEDVFRGHSLCADHG